MRRNEQKLKMRRFSYDLETQKLQIMDASTCVYHTVCTFSLPCYIPEVNWNKFFDNLQESRTGFIFGPCFYDIITEPEAPFIIGHFIIAKLNVSVPHLRQMTNILLCQSFLRCRPKSYQFESQVTQIRHFQVISLPSKPRRLILSRSIPFKENLIRKTAKDNISRNL